MKLGIGTVQFGLNYGVSNTHGKTSSVEVKAILDFAAKQNIKTIDTAALYGDSELVLGNNLSLAHPFSIITKTIKFSKPKLESTEALALQQAFMGSLNKLRQQQIYGLLLHDVNDLLVPGGEYLYEELLAFKQAGLVKKIGVSVYTPAQIEAVLTNYKIDLLQFPCNIFDQRLLKNNYLSQLKSAGIELHARSAFLQGLLLMTSENLPAYFAELKPVFEHYQQVLIEKKLTPLAAALGFVLGISAVDKVICGVNNCQQLQELYENALPLNSSEFSEFALNDERFIDPSRWQL